jgi:hypothetical protein
MGMTLFQVQPGLHYDIVFGSIFSNVKIGIQPLQSCHSQSVMGITLFQIQTWSAL